MAFRPEIYPEGWSRMRKEALERVDNQCEICHVQQDAKRRNTHNDRPYFVKLAVCHRLFYHTWKQEADTIVLCQRCHNRFDAKFRKRFKFSRETPLGRANVYVYEAGQAVLAEMCKTYIELAAVIDSFEPGRKFEVQLLVNIQIVGTGVYERIKTGVRVLNEIGAAIGLHLAFLVLPERMSSP